MRKVPQNPTIAKRPRDCHPTSMEAGRAHAIGTVPALTLTSGVEEPKTCLLYCEWLMFFFSFFFFVFAFCEEGNKPPGCIFHFHLFLVRGGEDFFFLLNPWYDCRYMTSTPQGPTTAFGKNLMANKNPKQNTTKEIKS